MVLHPLAEIGIRMLVAIRISRRQLVMHSQGRRKRGHREEQAGHKQSEGRTGCQPAWDERDKMEPRVHTGGTSNKGTREKQAFRLDF